MNADLIRALQSGKDYTAALEEAARPMRELIGQFLQQRPFQPFRLTLTGGSVREIRVPDGIVLGASTVNISVPNAAGQMEWRSTLALIHVVTLEPLSADEPAIVVERSPNGRD
jgi:hypothetical protein